MDAVPCHSFAWIESKASCKVPPGSSTTVVAATALFVRMGSKISLHAAARFVRMPEAAGTTVKAIVAEPPRARDPKSKMTAPACWVQVPWLPVAETYSTPSGSWLLTTRLEAASGPALVATSV